MTQIDWGMLRQAPDVAEAFSKGQAAGELQQRKQATQDILSSYAQNPSQTVPSALAFYDPQTYATLSQNQRQQAVANRATADALRTDNARAMMPDVLAGLGLGGRRAPAPAPATTGADGDLVVSAPVKHATVADLYAMDPELAGALVPRIGEMQDQDRKRLSFEADTLAAAAFAARQKPYAERRGVIDNFRRQLTEAGFSQTEIDEFDPSDEALGAAITHSLGIKAAMSQQLDQQKFAWQQQDDRIDNGRDDRRVAIQDRGQRDASARGWSADRRSERRYRRGDGINFQQAPTDDLIDMLEQR